MVSKGIDFLKSKLLKFREYILTYKTLVYNSTVLHIKDGYEEGNYKVLYVSRCVLLYFTVTKA